MFNWLYIHGFGSSPQGTKVTQLREYVEQRKLGYVHCQHFDYAVLSPTEVIAQISELCDRIAQSSSDKKLVVLGSSLGGFHALQSHIRTGCPTVVLNPAIQPSVSLRKYGLSNELLERYRRVEADFTGADFSKVQCIVCDDDEVIHHAGIESKGFELKRLASGGHRMHQFPDLLPEITGFFVAKTNSSKD